MIEKETIYQRLRRESLTEYYKKPNICKNCDGVIWVPEGKRVSEIKKKKFCSDECRLSYSGKKKAPAYKPYPGTIEEVQLDPSDKAPAPKARVLRRASTLLRHKAKQERKAAERSRIEPAFLRKCKVCGDDYDVKTRMGQPGKVTHCEDCAEEVEEKYVGNWTPAGASTGKNLHQWDITPVKGVEKHVPKSTVI